MHGSCRQQLQYGLLHSLYYMSRVLMCHQQPTWFDARLTLASRTPGAALSADSRVATQEAQLMPPTSSTTLPGSAACTGQEVS
jgi:hypothetical protein